MVNSMARYIDAGVFEKFIKEKYKDGESTDDIKDQMLFDLSYQPTAYNVDKVVDGLKDKARWIEYKTEDGLVMKQRVIPLAEAVNEVRKGGGRMTEQKAIEVIKYASAFNSDNSPLTKALDVAIKATEKQIAKKVEYHGGNYDCPICGKPAMAVSARKKTFCDFCGQKLDWSE